MKPIQADNTEQQSDASPFQAPTGNVMKQSDENLQISQVQPLPRFFARTIDYLIYGLIIGLILRIAGIDVDQWDVMDRVIDIIWSICLTFTWIFIEAYLLSNYGKTLGKHIIKAKVVDSTGSFLTYRRALERSFDVWLMGMCMGIIILEWVTMAFWYYKLKHDGITSWDKRDNSQVIHSKFNPIIVYVAISIYGFALLYYGLRALSAYLELSWY